MYRILIARSHRDNYASLYQFLVETTEQGETYPVEIETKEQLDKVVEDMLNNGGYSKSDFIIVKYIDYTIDAIDYTDQDKEDGDDDNNEDQNDDDENDNNEEENEDEENGDDEDKKDDEYTDPDDQEDDG